MMYVRNVRRIALIFVIAIAIAGSAPATSCITITRHPTDFLSNMRAMFYGRASHADQMFHVERVVRGKIRVGQRFPYPESICSRPEDGELYLMVQSCWEGEGCGVGFVKEEEAPRMMQFLAHAHRETHETVMAATLKWLRGEMPLDRFDDWINTVSIRSRASKDDGFLLRLLEELRNVLWSFERIEACDPSLIPPMRRGLDPFEKQLKTFPPGLAEEFDRHLEEGGDDEAWTRSSYEYDMLEWLKHVQRSEAWETAFKRCIQLQ